MLVLPLFLRKIFVTIKQTYFSDIDCREHYHFLLSTAWKWMCIKKLTLFKMSLFGAAHGEGGKKAASL